MYFRYKRVYLREGLFFSFLYSPGHKYNTPNDPDDASRLDIHMRKAELYGFRMRANVVEFI